MKCGAQMRLAAIEPRDAGDMPKAYVLDMFPYPSGAGLHVGHPLGYIGTDVFARYIWSNRARFIPGAFGDLAVSVDRVRVQATQALLGASGVVIDGTVAESSTPMALEVHGDDLPHVAAAHLPVLTAELREQPAQHGEQRRSDRAERDDE